MRTAAFFLATVAAVALAAPVAAIDLSRSPDEIAVDKEFWVTHLSEKQRELAEAKIRYADAQTSYQRMRTRPSSRGTKRSRAVAELKAAEIALDEAEFELEAALADARREGVPPGWIREASRRSSASPAALD